MHIGTVFTLILLSIGLIAYIAQPFLKEEPNPSSKSGKLSNITAQKRRHDPSKVCQLCGYQLRPQHHYCPQCGTQVRKID